MGVILTIVKMAWLVSSYSIIITYMTGLFPDLVLGIADFRYTDEIVSIFVSAVTTVRWIIGPNFFNFVMNCWLLLPAVKLVLYFHHKAGSFGDLAAFTINDARQYDLADDAANIDMIQKM